MVTEAAAPAGGEVAEVAAAVVVTGARESASCQPDGNNTHARFCFLPLFCEASAPLPSAPSVPLRPARFGPVAGCLAASRAARLSTST